MRGTIDVTYREPDLTITSISLPPGPLLSGQSVTVTYTVSNIGTRETREIAWDDRLYLSSDPSLDQHRPAARLVHALRHAGGRRAATTGR